MASPQAKLMPGGGGAGGARDGALVTAHYLCVEPALHLPALRQLALACAATPAKLPVARALALALHRAQAALASSAAALGGAVVGSAEVSSAEVSSVSVGSTSVAAVVGSAPATVVDSAVVGDVPASTGDVVSAVVRAVVVTAVPPGAAVVTSVSAAVDALDSLWNAAAPSAAPSGHATRGADLSDGVEAVAVPWLNATGDGAQPPPMLYLRSCIAGDAHAVAEVVRKPAKRCNHGDGWHVGAPSGPRIECNPWCSMRRLRDPCSWINISTLHDLPLALHSPSVGLPVAFC